LGNNGEDKLEETTEASRTFERNKISNSRSHNQDIKKKQSEPQLVPIVLQDGDLKRMPELGKRYKKAKKVAKQQNRSMVVTKKSKGSKTRSLDRSIRGKHCERVYESVKDDSTGRYINMLINQNYKRKKKSTSSKRRPSKTNQTKKKH
jgi:hypothetical protein